jgi:hypothetical protein
MPKTFKGFTPSEAVTFTLESPDGSRQATFRCRKNVPGSKFLEFMSRADQTENFAAMAGATREIIETALDDESIVAFWEFADNPDNGINLDTLAEIAGFLAESFVGDRPTARQPA